MGNRKTTLLSDHGDLRKGETVTIVKINEDTVDVKVDEKVNILKGCDAVPKSKLNLPTGELKECSCGSDVHNYDVAKIRDVALSIGDVEDKLARMMSTGVDKMFLKSNFYKKKAASKESPSSDTSHSGESYDV